MKKMTVFLLLAVMAVVAGCLVGCPSAKAQMGADDHSTYNPAPQQDQSSDNGDDNRSCNEHDWRNPHCDPVGGGGGGGCDDSPENSTIVLVGLAIGMFGFMNRKRIITPKGTK